MSDGHRNRRSLLVYSALAVQRWAEAVASGADIVLFDLEDGTAQPRKDEARAPILACFAAQGPGWIPGRARNPARSGPLRMLRINSPRTLYGLRDLVAVLDSAVPPDGLVLPKVSHPEEVRWVAGLLAARHPAVELIPLIEDQAGLRAAHEIAVAAPAVKALFLGSVDLSGELRAGMSWDALFDARATLVRATSAAGIDCIDGPWLDVHDEEGLRLEASRVAALGFTGKASYDPTQLEPIHAAFTPTAAEIELAERIVQAVEDSPSGGARVDGRSVNKANAKGARQVLERARRIGVIE